MPLSFPIPEEWVNRIAECAAEMVIVKLGTGTALSPWLTRKEAAVYLRVPVSRLEKDRRVPRHRWEGRVLYLRSELDAFVGSLDNERP